MKSKICRKAQEMFLELGFKSVTMDEIANKLGISKKTIYVHFANKTELIQATTFNMFEEISSQIESIRITANNPIIELYEVKLFLMRYLKGEKVSPQYQLQKFYPAIHKALQKKQYSFMLDSVKRSLQKGVELRIFRDNIDIEFISRMYFNGMNGIKNREVFTADLFHPDYLMESYLDYHLRAIVTPKGLKQLNKINISKAS